MGCRLTATKAPYKRNMIRVREVNEEGGEGGCERTMGGVICERTMGGVIYCKNLFRTLSL